MPRNYKNPLGSRMYKNYSEHTLEEALIEVVEGSLSLLKASKQFNIPFVTLHNKYYDKHPHSPKERNPSLKHLQFVVIRVLYYLYGIFVYLQNII